MLEALRSSKTLSSAEESYRVLENPVGCQGILPGAEALKIMRSCKTLSGAEESCWAPINFARC